MTTTEKKVACIAVLAVSMACAGCSTGTQPAPPTTSAAGVPTATTPTSTAPRSYTDGTDGTDLSVPSVIVGDDEQAIRVTSEAFIMGWASYRSAAFQPRRQWFQSWQHTATQAFIDDMRHQFTTLWSWTWNEDKQVLGAQVDGTIAVAIDGSVAVARVPVKRWVMGLDTRASDATSEHTVFDLFFVLDPRRAPLVDDARPVRDDEPFPPTIWA